MSHFYEVFEKWREGRKINGGGRKGRKGRKRKIEEETKGKKKKGGNGLKFEQDWKFSAKTLLAYYLMFGLNNDVKCWLQNSLNIHWKKEKREEKKPTEKINHDHKSNGRP